MREKTSILTVDSRVACFVMQAVNNSRKTQVQIAKEVGFYRPNVISMIKTGRMKLPVNKVQGFADAVDVDPVELLSLVLEEDQPEVWRALTHILGIEKVATVNTGIGDS
ncbi:helix-turn-helix domain-containing protein [Amphritea balenae]|uniref:XRE family transcriptional regulator n=1 Tax=Amphritea balenae TaxID=452629 RepID=A0A3P1SN02_9GAMM|nr:helix-turn-helix transcriptional regulator [Amphritea balenae]RRC98497.1 hypothetical protein EHS89_12815 [Amphritea balenae]GGK64993.1 hypothetical protein GCM10007941_13890 [Amphritea balenae]